MDLGDGVLEIKNANKELHEGDYVSATLILDHPLIFEPLTPLPSLLRLVSLPIPTARPLTVARCQSDRTWTDHTSRAT